MTFRHLLPILLVLWHPVHADELLAEGGRPVGDTAAYQVAGDMNGDGIADRAVLATNGKEIRLRAAVSRRRGGFAIHELVALPQGAEGCNLELLPPGSYPTACGKGYFDCAEGEPEIIRASHPLLALHDHDVVSVFLFRLGGVRRIWLSD